MHATAEAVAPAVQRLVETALLGEGWPGALSRFAEAAGASGAVIVNEPAQSRAILLPTESVAEPVADYQTGKAPPDPRTALVMPRPEGGFVTDFDTFKPDEIARDPFYTEFLRPLGLGWHACALLAERPSGDRLYLSLKRAYRHGHYEQGDVEVLNAALPALRNASSIARALFEAEARGQARALAAGSDVVFAIDRAGRASLREGARNDILDRDLLLVGGRLVASFPPDRPALDAAVARSIGTPGRSGVAVLSSLDARRRLLVRTVPVTGWARDVFGAAAALATVRVWPGPAGPKGETVAALREAFGLTTAEAQVAALVATGLSPRAAARLLAVGEGTARNHLKAAMAKADVHRQAELADLTASLRP